MIHGEMYDIWQLCRISTGAMNSIPVSCMEFAFRRRWRREVLRRSCLPCAGAGVRESAGRGAGAHGRACPQLNCPPGSAGGQSRSLLLAAVRVHMRPHSLLLCTAWQLSGIALAHTASRDTASGHERNF